MQSEKGIEIENVHHGGIAEKSGLLPGDILISINARTLRDPIDFMFYGTDDLLEMKVKRSGETMHIRVPREGEKEFGIDFKPFKVRTCKNNCIFCFVRQLPRGLRKSLYLRDEDYRMSFLYGNYVTLTNLSSEDRKRIVEQRLSPLYISVHSTNRSLRNRLLGNVKSPDILGELKFLTNNKIRLHTQIVLCPGLNDGKELYQTILDLSRFYPYVSSIAVVPVGLTRYRKSALRPVEKEEAREALKIIESFQKRFRKKHGDPLVYGADELYIKAEFPFSPLKDYRDMPQIENGVGMVPFFMASGKKFRIPRSIPRKKRFLTFTGISFYPFLKKFTERLSEKEGLAIEVVPVENTFFGLSITVTGLLTGRDVIRTLTDTIGGHEILLVPDVVLRDRENVFLDDITIRDLEGALSIPAQKIESTPEGLIRGMTGE